MKALQPFLLHGSAGQAEVPQQEFWASTERRPWGKGKCLPRLGGGTLKTPPHPCSSQTLAGQAHYPRATSSKSSMALL